MNVERYGRAVLISLMGAALALPVLYAADAAPAAENRKTGWGTIVGIVRSPAKAPVGGATITATRGDGSAIRATISGSDGVYSFADMAPGVWSITSQADGYADTTVSSLEVTAGRATRTDIGMAAGAPAPAVISSTAPAPAPATQPVAANENAVPTPNLASRLLRRPQTYSRDSLPPPISEPVQTASLNAPPAGAFDTPSSAPGVPNPQGPTASPAPAPAAQGAQEAAAPAAPAVDLKTPFADYDWTWLNGNPRNHDVAFDSPFFTPEIRADLTYTWDFNHPADDSMGGSSELFRSDEIQLEQLGIGGDFHWDNIRARFMTQFGAYSTATIRNDGSYSKGQWDLADADRYLSEAYGGWHINWLHGVNIDAGIFMSYVGLFSYYNFDNWAYQPSYVSSNTPWFFQGIRIQFFPTHHLKLEPWIINGWQSYGSANSRKGLGGQIKYTPFSWLNIISNEYALGHDDLYAPGRGRIHTDNSFEVKYYDHPERLLDKMAFSFTGDLGCEFGDGVSCHNDSHGNPKQSFIGYMFYNRFWFAKDKYGITLGGGQINNPGRYLVLIPPINGESASSASINSPYFTFNPGDPFKAWDTSLTLDWMPKQWMTLRVEGDYRHANVPYWSGPGGVTPPAFLGSSTGTNNGYPSQYVCMDGTPAGTSLTSSSCSSDGGVWYPDLRKNETLIDIDLLVKF